MATSAKLARGSQIKVEDSPGAGTYTSIPEMKNISLPQPTVNEIDVTNHDSPSGVTEFLLGTIDAGEATFDGNYLETHAKHVQLRSDQLSRTTRKYRVTLPSPSTRTYTFDAFVKSVQIALAHDGVQTINVTLRATGPVTDA